MRPIFAQTHVRETQLSALAMSDSESAGNVAASYFDRRSHRAPHDWPSPLLRFLAPSRQHFSPSAASRPYPHANSDPQAA